MDITPEVQRICDETTAEWLQIAYCTDPARRDLVEAAVPGVYAACRYPAPPPFVCIGCLTGYRAEAYTRPPGNEPAGVCSCGSEIYYSMQWVGSPGAAVRLAAKLIGGVPATHVMNFCFGQHASGWLVFYAAWGKLGEDLTDVLPLLEIARNGHWWMPYEKLAIFVDRPSFLALDERRRLHHTEHAALTYRDGHQIYAIHGVTVPSRVVVCPETITWQEIDAESNAEVRRVMMERYTTERYLRDSGAEMIAEDEYGQLYRKNVAGDEPVVMVRVINSTPENALPGTWHWEIGGRRVTDAQELRHIARSCLLDGHADGYHWVCAGTDVPLYKDYWLRVPPSMTTAHEAVAWTFGKTADTYAPDIET